MLLSVYETQSYEESMEDYGYGAGFLFSVIRYDPVAYEQDYLASRAARRPDHLCPGRELVLRLVRRPPMCSITVRDTPIGQ